MNQSEAKSLPHLPYLDGWRGVAILLVLGGHFFNFPAARLGVEVFFALSGLLMSKILFEKKVPLGIFYKRRFARILPAFYLYLGTVAIVSAAVMNEFPVGQLFFNSIFLQSYVPSNVPLADLPIRQLWSLNVEEHSYIFLTLIALGTRNTRIVRVLLTIAAGLCVLAYLRQGVGGALRTECAALPLLASAALNLWLIDVRLLTKKIILVVSLLAIPVCVVISRQLHSSVVIDMIIKPVMLSFAINVLYVAPPLLHRLLSVVWLRWFGLCSFSIYLWQGAFELWVRQGVMNPFLGLALSLVIGAASFYFFENPMRKLIRESGKVKATSPPSTLSAG